MHIRNLAITMFMFVCSLPYSVAADNKTPYNEVNTFIGTGKEGNCFPGAQAPFGMISISPNNTFSNYEDPSSRPGYKYSQTEINGFGMTHFSGVGCHAMQDLPFLPLTGDLDKSPVNDKYAYRTRFSHADEKATPGFYSVKLADYQIDTKFTTTTRSAIGEFSFHNEKDAHVIFAPTNNANGIGDGELHIESSAMTVTGWVSTGGFCWRDPRDRPYKVFFVARFNTPFKGYGVWKGKSKENGKSNVAGDDIAAFLSFGNQKGKTIKMKMAISYVSIDNAKENLKNEIVCWDFDNVYQTTKEKWTSLLSRITANGGTDAERQSFYTAIYHNLLHPNVYNDVNGEYMGFDDQLHHIASGRQMYANFSLWDTYRTSAYLQAMIAPKEASDMVNSLLLDAEQGGAYPNWSMNNIEYGVMNGYSTFPFIANMYAMGARNFNLQAVKDMMKKVSVKHIKCKGHHGWEHVEDYMTLGYVPVDKHGHGASMTLEYSIDDFSIAQICKTAGDSTAYYYYSDRAQSYENIFDTNTKMLRARKSDGTFSAKYSPSETDGFNEGNAAQYFWSVPHNMKNLIDLAGGKAHVEKQLDTFSSKINHGWAIDEPYYWLGNEPCFGSAYVYNYLGKAWKSQRLVRKILSDFNNTPDGLPGDDDAGAMSALYVFSAMGIYPYIPGIGGFVVVGPLFSKVQIKLSNGKAIILNAPNAQENNPYIQSMTINNKPKTSTWIAWDKLKDGATLNFKMGDKPNEQWGSGANDAPPSFY